MFSIFCMFFFSCLGLAMPVVVPASCHEQQWWTAAAQNVVVVVTMPFAARAAMYFVCAVSTQFPEIKAFPKHLHSDSRPLAAPALTNRKGNCFVDPFEQQTRETCTRSVNSGQKRTGTRFLRVKPPISLIPAHHPRGQVLGERAFGDRPCLLFFALSRSRLLQTPQVDVEG